MDASEKYYNPNPKLTANNFNKLFFWWLKPLFFSRTNDNFGIKNLYNILPENDSVSLGDKLEKAWNEQLKNVKKNKNGKPSLLKASYNSFGCLFWYYGLHVFIICAILRGLLPYVLGLLIWHFDSRSNSTNIQAYTYATILIAMIILQAMVGHHSVIGRKEVGMRLSVAHSALIYRKILKLSISASNKYDAGKIINLLSNDVAKFEDVCMFLHYVWVLPIQGIVMAYFIWDKVGISSLAGIIFLTFQTIPIQGYLGKVTARIRAKVASKTDERVRLMSEIVNGIRLIKMYAWEKPFEKFVILARRQEIDAIAVKSYLRALSAATSVFAENTSLFFIIITYVLLGNALEASIVYSVAQYLHMIKTMMTVFYPRAISSTAEAKVSIQRIEILKVNMDGSSPQKIVINSNLVSLAVETQTATLYFSTTDEISSCDYTGSNQRIAVHTSSTAFSLGISGTRLFWTQAPLNTGFGTLWACSVTASGSCSNQEEFDFVDPRNVRVYTGDYSSSGITNPCEESNGGCSQLCLLKPGGYSCACYIGYELDDDEKSCNSIKEYLLYARGEFVRGRIANARKNTFTDAIEPFSFKVGKLRNRTTVDFDYNYYARKIAISHDNGMYVFDLNEPGVLEDYSVDGCVKQVAYDWVTNDIYYVRDTCNVMYTSGILILQPRAWTYKTKILQIFVEGNGHPSALAMHPNNGVYFFTIKRTDSVSIFKIRGSKTTLIANENVHEVALTIDFHESRLYWFSADLKFVYSSDFEGKDSKSINVSIIGEPRSISLDDRYIYISNLTSIWRIIKSNGYGAIKLIPTYDDDNADKLISAVKVYSKEIQIVHSDNPCAINNGDCEEFCFRTPFILSSGGNAVNDTGEVHKKCLCENYKTIKPDGKSCSFERVTQDPRIYGHVPYAG